VLRGRLQSEAGIARKHEDGRATRASLLDETREGSWQLMYFWKLRRKIEGKE